MYYFIPVTSYIIYLVSVLLAYTLLEQKGYTERNTIALDLIRGDGILD